LHPRATAGAAEALLGATTVQAFRGNGNNTGGATFIAPLR
jgi:hypothetical protein